MSNNYRYWCGECGHRTPWLTESQGADAQLAHYGTRHPGLPPGGRVEVRQRSNGGGGCAGLILALFLLILAASTCAPETQSAPPVPHSRTR